METRIEGIDRLVLAILVALLTLVAGAQAYRAGERAERTRNAYENAERIVQAQKAGWNACMDQF